MVYIHNTGDKTGNKQHKESKDMTKDNQNVKETKATLKDQLLAVGLNDDASFKRAKKAYDSRHSKQRIKGDLDKWHTEGAFWFAAKEAMKAKKINPNSGHLTKIRETYFPELTAQDVSNSIWLHENYPHVLEWIEKNKRSLSNPASIKQAITKDLKSRKYANEVEKGDAFNHFGLKPPKPSNTKPKGNEPKRNNVDLKDNLEHLSLITSQLLKIGTKSWTVEQFKRFEVNLRTLENFYEDLDERLQKAKITKVNDNVAKKKAA